jgi:hypothetical protein
MIKVRLKNMIMIKVRLFSSHINRVVLSLFHMPEDEDPSTHDPNSVTFLCLHEFLAHTSRCVSSRQRQG